MVECKDKKKVVGELMIDEQIKVFLDFLLEEGENLDFYVLFKVYCVLWVEDFECFVVFFQVQNCDICVIDDQGCILLDIVCGYGRSEFFVVILEKVGG